MFIEKPLSNTLKDIVKLENLVRRRKLICLVGCDHRFHPCIVKIKEILEDGVLGKIISSSVESGSYLPDWHPYEDYRNGYAARDDLGGGITLTMIHELDFLKWFFGDVKNIFGIVGKFSNLDVKTDDLAMMTLIFKNNIISQLNLDFFQRPEFKSCKIKGSKGILFWNSESNEVKIFLNKHKNWKIIFQEKNFERNLMFEKELDYFLKCIKNNKNTFNDLREGANTLNIALTAKKSSQKEKLLKIDSIMFK